jgi:hypothetical protein
MYGKWKYFGIRIDKKQRTIRHVYVSCQDQLLPTIHIKLIIPRAADHRVGASERMDKIVRAIGQGIFQIIGGTTEEKSDEN